MRGVFISISFDPALEAIEDDTMKRAWFQDFGDSRVRGKLPAFKVDYEEVARDTTFPGNGSPKS